MIDLSVVIPLLDEAKNLERLYEALLAALGPTGKSFEIVFIDDGSRDDSFEIIRRLSDRDARVRGISLSRNFGHQIALYAGIEAARGAAVVTMDADLQHPPELIPRLVAEYENGFDVVNTRRVENAETGLFKRLSSAAFYKLLNALSDVKIEPGGADYRLLSRRAADAFLRIREKDRFMRGLVAWMGFRQQVVSYQANARHAGSSKYTFKRMLRFALDGITSFSAKPLKLSFLMGAVTSGLGLLYALYALIQVHRGAVVPGWASILISVLLLGGIQLLSLGVLGEYIARIFNETKARPLYLVREIAGKGEPAPEAAAD